MTYKDLLDFLKTVPESRLLDNVTVMVDGGEYLPVEHVVVAEGDDVLDDGHIILCAIE
jgi:hypothetical protein